ncbi:MAG: 50S ribosomal protein L25 [Candidatus Eremiobacterota bacterium]
MAQVKLESRHREGTGKGVARKLRRDGRVPGVLYGHKQTPVSLDLDAKAVNHLLHEYGHNAIITLSIQGGPGGEDTCMIVDFQRDIYQRELIHVDLKRISLQEKIETQVPVHVVGDEKIAKEGGVIELMLPEVEVRCLPLAIPENIEVDVSGLELGDNLQAGALTMPEGVELVTEADHVVLIVHIPRAVAEGEGEAAPAAEGAAAPAPAAAE